MSALDVILLACLGLGLVHGLVTGFIRQVADLVGLVIGVILAIRLMTPFGLRLQQLIGGNELVMRIIAFVLVIIAVQLVAFIAARVLERVVGFVRLSLVNRTVGGVFGVVKTGLLLSIALLALAGFDVPSEETQKASVLYRPISAIVPASWHLVADHVPEIGVNGLVNGRESTSSE